MSFTHFKREYWLELEGWSEDALRLCELAYEEGNEEGEGLEKAYDRGEDVGYNLGMERGRNEILNHLRDELPSILKQHTLFVKELTEQIIQECKKLLDQIEETV